MLEEGENLGILTEHKAPQKLPVGQLGAAL